MSPLCYLVTKLINIPSSRIQSTNLIIFYYVLFQCLVFYIKNLLYNSVDPIYVNMEQVIPTSTVYSRI